MASKQELKNVKDELKALKSEVKENRVSDMGKVFDQFINRDMKSYEDNFRIIGLKYDIKDAQKDGEEFQDAFINRILNVFVTSKVIQSDRLFHQEGKERGRLRSGVLRNLHPLSQRNNAAVVVAFTQSWMTSRIRQRLQSGKGLVDGVKIFQHYPPIIETLKNEAMKERRRLLDLDDKDQRIIVQIQFKKPWVILIKMLGRDKCVKSTLPFPVDDERLADPGKTLAELALTDEEFVPKAFLDDAAKAGIKEGIYPAAALPQRRPASAMDTSK